jgi:hypothetical protein
MPQFQHRWFEAHLIHILYHRRQAPWQFEAAEKPA